MNRSLTANRALSLLLSLLMTLQPFSLAAADLAEDLEATSRQLAAQAERLTKRIDRAQFELDALLDQLDYDPEEIVRFVREEISLEVYPGALRGARGTLMSRAGNALDQALLLATLLKDAGEDAVIYRATLSESLAAELLNRMADRTDPPPPPLFPDPAAMLASAAKKPAVDNRRAGWLNSAEAGGDQLLGALDAAGVVFDVDALQADLLAESRDYYWVSYGVGPRNRWQAAHPALGRDPELAPEATIAETIPEDLLHSVTFELLLDRRLGSSVEEVALISPISRTSVELAEKPFTLSLLPDQFLNPAAPLDLDEIAARSRFLLPMINASIAPGGQAMSLRGLTVPPDALQMGAAGLFETVSGKFVDALDELSATSSADQEAPTQVAIERIRLRTTFRSPGIPDRVQEREWFDAARDLEEATRRRPPGAETVKALARSQLLIGANGRIAPGTVLEGLYRQARSNHERLALTPDILDESCTTLACLADLEFEEIGREQMLTMIYLGLDDQFAEAEDVRAYRHSPNLLGLNRAVFPGSDRTLPEVDILSNARRLLKVANGSVMPDPRSLVRAGVWDTQVESRFFRLAANPDLQTEKLAPRLRVFRSPRELDPQNGNSNSLARALRRDLAAGYTVVAAGSVDLSKDSVEQRWWRVDPKTGTSLGMTQFGGASITEALVLTLLIAAIMFALDVVAAQICSDDPPNAAIADLADPQDRFRACLMCESYFTTATYYLLFVLGSGFSMSMDQIAARCYRAAT